MKVGFVLAEADRQSYVRGMTTVTIPTTNRVAVVTAVIRLRTMEEGSNSSFSKGEGSRGSPVADVRRCSFNGDREDRSVDANCGVMRCQSRSAM